MAEGGRNASERYSLAGIRGPALAQHPALLTVAKLGSRGSESDREQQLILRIYNPSEEAEPVTIELRAGNNGPSGTVPRAVQVNALEKPIANADVELIDLRHGRGTVTFTAIRSLTALCEGAKCPK